MIDERDEKFMKIHRLYQKQNVFTMEGEKYKSEYATKAFLLIFWIGTRERKSILSAPYG
jgi:hypothetical protein